MGLGSPRIVPLSADSSLFSSQRKWFQEEVENCDTHIHPPHNMADVSTFSVCTTSLSEAGKQAVPGVAGRPSDEAGSAFEIVSDAPDVVLNILC